jgi:hypothetical protein
MEQTDSVKVFVVKLRPTCLIALCLIALMAGLVEPTATPAVKAQTRYTASPVKWYLDTRGIQDKLFPDYVVEFEVPKNATNIVVYATTAGIESRVLAFSTVDSTGTRNGKKVVKVVTGYSARKCSPSKDLRTWTCVYTGSLFQWACSLRVRYYW